MKFFRIAITVILISTMLVISGVAMNLFSPNFFDSQISKDDSIDYALNGFDPVEYFKNNKASKGSKKFSSEYNGTRWLFNSINTKSLFDSDPETYSIGCGDFCSPKTTKK